MSLIKFWLLLPSTFWEGCGFDGDGGAGCDLLADDVWSTPGAGRFGVGGEVDMLWCCAEGLGVEVTDGIDSPGV